MSGVAAVACTAVGIAFVSHVAPAGELATATWPFHGCEADDVRALAGATGGRWQGEQHTIGPLTLRHRAWLECSTRTCAARVEMDAVHDRSSLPAPAVVPAPLAVTARGSHKELQMQLDGPDARSLARDMGSASYLDGGQRHRIVLDQGTLARSVLLRIRTVVSCDVDADRCTIASDPVVYVPYDDTLKCGALASDSVPAF